MLACSNRPVYEYGRINRSDANCDPTETIMNAQITKGTAVITGASSGIGAIYADRLAHRGYNLLLVARNEERLRSLSERLARESGREVQVLVADLTVTADLRRIEARLRSDPAITMLVNNA